MKVGIIVYSKTGNTKSVAEKMNQAFSEAGNEASLEEVTTVGEPGAKVELKDIPATDTYDAIIFAGPVWAFSLCSVMKQYLGGVPSLEGKKIGVFVTQSFKKPWLGGNKAVRCMKRLCEAKTGVVSKTGVINWNNPKRDEQIDALVKDFTAIQSALKSIPLILTREGQ